MKEEDKVLREFIKKVLIKEHYYLIEGIDVDEIKKTVSFNNSHEENVDTSTLINPTYENIGGVDVISIFKRKKSSDFSHDGNPLIYALKGIKGWKFNNEQSDIIGLLRQFIRIAEKIQPKYDTIITIPSNNVLNKNFLFRLNKVIKADVQIQDYLHKLTAEEVYEEFVDWVQISQDFGERYNKIKSLIASYFKNMDNEYDGYFSYKFIKDVKLRKYIKKTMYSDSEKTIEYASHINGKNILILDDTIGSGSTISEACKEIFEMFSPKSITVITLFSKL